MHCSPLSADAKPLNDNEENDLIKELKDWKLNREEVHKLTRTVKTETFPDAINLIGLLARVSQEEQHHPDLHLYYNKLVLDLYSHKAGGLTMNDFILAAKFGELIESVRH